jgi:hypothetical protein
MPRDPYPTVLEYLRAPEPQMRRNAVTALAVLGMRPSARTLVETALHDPDAGVRDRAEAELVDLTDDDGFVPHAMEECLRTAGTRDKAYALAGRLRRRGWRGRPRLGPLPGRLAAANGLRTLVYPDRDIRFRTRVASVAFFSTILGAVLLGWLLRVSGVEPNDGLYFGFVLAGVLAMMASQRAVPLALHYDAPAGVAVEVAWAVALTLFPGVLAVLPALYYSTDQAEGPFFAMGLAGVPLLAAAVRAATLAVGGAWGPRATSRWVATAAGTGAGWLVSTALYALWGGRGGSPAMGGMWLLCLLVSITLAAVFAAVDFRGQPTRALLGRRSRTLGTALAAVAAVPVLLLHLPHSGRPVHLPALEHTVVPAEVQFTLAGRSLVGAAVLSARMPDSAGTYSPPEYEAGIHDAFGPPVAHGTLATADLSGGEYHVTVRRTRDDEAAAVFERLAEPLAALLPRRASGDSVYLELVPLPDSAALDDFRTSRVYNPDLVHAGESNLRYGNVPLAVQLLQAAEAAHPGWVTPGQWHSLCWQGTLTGTHFRDPGVVAACRRAVGDGRSPEAGVHRGGRGLNRMLNGDAAGAEQDLGAFLVASPAPAVADTVRVMLRGLRAGDTQLPESRRSFLRLVQRDPAGFVPVDTVMATPTVP